MILNFELAYKFWKSLKFPIRSFSTSRAITCLYVLLLLSSTSVNAQWTEKSDGLEGCPIDALHSDGSSIFAGTLVGVYGSTFTTDTWSFMNGPASPYNQFLNINCIVGTSDNLFAGTPYGAMRSQNGGQSWTALRTGMQRSVQCMLFLNNKIYAGSGGGGIYRSDNNGESWTPIINGLSSSTAVYAIVNSGNIIYIATSDGVFSSDDEGASWQEIHPENDIRFVNTLVVMENMIIVGSNYLKPYVSVHDGTNWSSWVASGTGLPASPDFNALVVHNESVYAGTEHGLYRYDSDANNWTLIQNDQLDGLPISSLHSSGTTLLAGTSDGVYLSTDNGNSWSTRKTGLSCTQVSRFVPLGNQLLAQTNNGLFALPGNALKWSQVNKQPIGNLTRLNDKLFSSGMSGIQVSEDGGLTWTQANSGLPPNAIVGAMVSHGSMLFVGLTVNYSTFDVYASSDQGASWALKNTGLPNVNLVREFVSKDGNIYAVKASLKKLAIKNRS